jgi:hypothetical protein
MLNLDCQAHQQLEINTQHSRGPRCALQFRSQSYLNLNSNPDPDPDPDTLVGNPIQTCSWKTRRVETRLRILVIPQSYS